MRWKALQMDNEAMASKLEALRHSLSSWQPGTLRIEYKGRMVQYQNVREFRKAVGSRIGHLNYLHSTLNPGTSWAYAFSMDFGLYRVGRQKFNCHGLKPQVLACSPPGSKLWKDALRDDFLTVSALASALGVSSQSVYYRIKKGKIPAAKVNGRWILDKNARTWKF
jgi:hypothetical protein